MSSYEYDICIIGSGAGSGPVAYELSNAGFKVLVLEKGPWFKTKDFTKDEITAVRRDVYTPRLIDEPQVIETKDREGNWVAKSNANTGQNFWNGSLVGGSSNFMSGYFHRMKPNDFKLLSTYGGIEGSNVVDWPISYKDLEPYYTKVEKVVGVSGRILDHKFQEPRSTPSFPQKPLAENIVSHWIDNAAEKLGYQMVPIPRAILSKPKDNRNSCVYSNYCGSYACASDAKGSSRAALLNQALDTQNCKIIPNAKVYHLETNGTGQLIKAHYYDISQNKKEVTARIFVVAAQAIETARLLLMSKNTEFPEGLSNNNNQVGKNLIFSAGGTGSGQFFFEDLAEKEAEELQVRGLFVNRSLHNWYEIDDEKLGGKVKGGTIDFLFEHANATTKAIRQKWDDHGNLLFGPALKKKLKAYFTEQRKLKFEVFADWLPTDDCFVRLDPKVTDKWGDPVARIRLGYHPHDLKVGKYLAEKAEKLLAEMGAKNIKSHISGGAPPNLVVGGCRFGNDPKTSVLDKNCKSHEVDNLYITDGSFMPTGGSVTYTWTIYANSFRVADKIKERLS